MHAFIHMYIWIKKEKGNDFHFPKVTCCLFPIATERWTFLIFWLWEWIRHSILLDLDHEDRWLLKWSRLKKLEPFCVVIGRGRRDDGVLCCPSPLRQYLLRACSFLAAPCLNMKCLKLNAHKCDLFLRPTAVRGYANTSYVWMSFWNHPCPVHLIQVKCMQGAWPESSWVCPGMRSESTKVSRLHCFISMGLKPGLLE